jgi:hypothetical protein
MARHLLAGDLWKVDTKGMDRNSFMLSLRFMVYGFPVKQLNI